MPKRIRLGTVTNGTLDSEDARFEIDGNGNLVVDVADGDVLPGSNDPSLGTSSDPWPAVTTEEASITDETFVDVEPNADVTGVTADEWSSGDWAAATTDNRDEFDETNDVFTPDKTGLYFVQAVLRCNSPSDTDRLQARWRNTSDSIAVIQTDQNPASGTVNQAFPQIIGVVSLTAGKNYTPQFRNRDSSFAVGAVGYMTIRSVFG